MNANEPTPRTTRAVDVLERILAPSAPAAESGGLCDLRVVSWSDGLGTLSDGRIARRSVSCLVQPAADDRVLAWRAEDGEWWVLSVLSRGSAPDAPTVLASDGPLTVDAPRVALRSPELHLQAENLLIAARHHYTVSDVRTDSTRLRVADVGTDVRRARQATDEITGTFLQRAGAWFSHTLREARIHARAVLFD